MTETLLCKRRQRERTVHRRFDTEQTPWRLSEMIDKTMQQRQSAKDAFASVRFGVRRRCSAVIIGDTPWLNF